MIVLTLTTFAILSFKSISATDTCDGELTIRGEERLPDDRDVLCTDAQGCNDCIMTLLAIDSLKCGNIDSCSHVDASIEVGDKPLEVECGGKYSCAESTVRIYCAKGQSIAFIKCTADYACSGSEFIIHGCDVNVIECDGDFACAGSIFSFIGSTSDPPTISCGEEDDATVCDGLKTIVLDQPNIFVTSDATAGLTGLCCGCSATGPGAGDAGCNDPDCVVELCADDAFCCTSTWDSICGEEAAVICFANLVTTPAATTAAPVITTPAATTAAPIITTPAATTAPIITTAAATTAPVITDVVSDDDDGDDDDIDDDDIDDDDDGDDIDDDDGDDIDDDDGDDVDDDDDSVDDSSSLANVGDVSKWSELTTAEAASSVWAIVGYVGLFIVICVVCVLFVIPVYKRHREGLHKGNTKDFVDSTDNVLAVVADGDDDTATGLTQNP